MSVLLLAGFAMLAAAPAVAEEILERTIPGLIARQLPIVVNITARALVAGSTAATGEEQPEATTRVSAGSGFVIDPAGLIGTNWHVVDGAYEITVTFADGERADATVLNAVRFVDLAVLKVATGHPLQAAQWGDSSRLQIGDPVLAIGNALGLGTSVSAGIVSALNRNIMESPYDEFIQTDAAINHGNSGGPLFNAKGEVVGVNTALISPTAASAGLGFAIPANDARIAFDRLIHRELGRPGWLGLKVQPVTDEIARGLGEPGTNGSIVSWLVPGGPAARAGLQLGDVIVRYGELTPSDDRALLREIAKSKPGSAVALGIRRGGLDLEITVTPAEWPLTEWEARLPAKVASPSSLVPADLGLAVAPQANDLRVGNDILTGRRGVVLTAVRPGTDAARHGLAAGDVILQVGGTPVLTAEQMQREIDRARAEHRAVALFLVLQQRQMTAEMRFPGPRWIPLRTGED